MNNAQADVVIIGGGLAGLACAATLAEKGLRSVVLESRPRLGGRATSITDPVTGEEIDNCQHVAMGCCVNFLDFCKRLGIGDCFIRESKLTFVDAKRRQSVISANPILPAPFNLAGAFGRANFLSIRDKIVLARGLMALYHSSFRKYNNFADFLKKHHQTPGTIYGYWEPVLVSALSESLDRIDFAAGRKVFVDGFRASQVVVAVPWFNIQRVLPNETLNQLVPSLEKIEAAPISSVHLWYDRPVTELRHAVLLERHSQWVFNRTLILEHGTPERFAYQVVISQSRDLLSRPQAEIASLVDRELREAFQVSEDVKLVHSRVITEHKAVFSPLTGSEDLRPDQATSVRGLVLAGDWTQTGWPATMEGAVISGYRAAEEILRAKGIESRIVQESLPTRWWTKFFLSMGRLIA